MNALWKSFVLGSLMVSLAAVSQARVHAWISINPFPIIVGAPAPVVAQPAVVADPYAPPPQDYGQMLADFHDRARRLQRLLDHQLNRGIISQRQYDRHADALDRILQDERQDAALHNGALTPREVNDLNHRLLALQDRIHDDIAG